MIRAQIGRPVRAGGIEVVATALLFLLLLAALLP